MEKSARMCSHNPRMALMGALFRMPSLGNRVAVTAEVPRYVLEEMGAQVEEINVREGAKQHHS